MTWGKTWAALAGSVALAISPAHAATMDAGASCRVDSTIPAAERGEIEDVASRFVESLVAGDTVAAYAAMSDDGRTATPSQFFTGVLFPLLEASDLGPRSINHTYLVRTDGEPRLGHVLCADPEQSAVLAEVAFVNVSNQALVEVRIPTFNNDLALILLLIRDGPNWRVHGFHVAGLSMAGKDGFEILARGREQARMGHRLNATLLFMAGMRLLDRGPNLRLAGIDALEEEMGRFEAAPQLMDGPPFIWVLGDRTYTVGSAEVLAIAGDLYLMISLPLDSWPDNKAADARNRLFLSAFVNEHPEWKSAFKGVYAKAISPAGQTPQGGPSYTTLYSEAEGFGAPPID